jgi:hypothetical protein
VDSVCIIFNTAVTHGSNREPRQEMVAGPRHVVTPCGPFLWRHVEPIQIKFYGLEQTSAHILGHVP